MKISMKWLADYVQVPDEIKAFCDQLDLTGTGVEEVDRLGDTFDHIVTAQVVSKEPHPDSDHMFVCQVDVGQAEPIQVVCGAQNFNQGDHIITALVGAELPGGIKIKKSKLRGVTSNGMNCSARELGLGNDHSGIMILPEDAPIGMPAADYLGIGDTVLDLEITPNRPDSLSVVGFAREVGAMYDIDITLPSRELTETDELTSDAVAVQIPDPELCPRYTARLIRNVKVGPSPDWLVERLAAIGQRSINNIVDVTNYVLFELGQPLHTFDFDTLDVENGKATIIVRAAEEGEKITTLDGAERELTSDMTVISTPKRAVALAGVMGGIDSEVTEGTTNVLLEAATFNQAHTSRTSRNLGLISESSIRYERRVDDHDIDWRSDYAAALIAEVSGGTVCKGIVDEWPAGDTPARELPLRVKRCQQMLGDDVPVEFMKSRLTRLGCTVADTEDPDVLSVTVPTYRPDLEREIDLYEEVLRLYGMDRIPSTLPAGRGRVGVLTPQQLIDAKLHRTLSASGMNETMTYSFAHVDDLENLRMKEDGLGDPVELINPMNAEQAHMRRTIIPGLLRSIAYNQSRGVNNIQLYEIGTVFAAHEGSKKPKERRKLAGVLAGSMGVKGWNTDPAPFDFFDGKGVLESIARELALPKVTFRALSAEDAPHLQPGRAARMLSGGDEIGWIGEIHPLAADAFDAKAPIVAFELDMNALERNARPARDYVDVPQFPEVARDAAFVVDETVTNEKLMQCMKSAGGKLLEEVRLFDVYRSDKHLGAGKKSMAYSLTYRAADRTLTSEEVDKAHNKLIDKTCRATGAEVRG
ncbi:Phenylalanine--tRNA ligase beta subunit [Slackia heliotrinireducens]|uniref:Phenylalanine--tRNA ligase beta subunit n=1 Tax=Slackia heliotrinireducens (strain ATCC 29202 / DSM 20476 / NCTC 11029 / RHS 1) TaxID=471855 RepID=C7N308_SLAHD|nr:phenylalanine--tRNA ligase subunit beta [Slackia heliotrinireducens]ACV21529.1 phenylalanyl-tRNA synthetase, beta subunit [Slackia heliotrinireducens DSM 20476]VEG99003.1 Phenylalanine--tRNA ligase beta subunit [Slackia heliotrinireducens]